MTYSKEPNRVDGSLNFCSENIKGFISDIQTFSVGDGPGIRTTVFFKGCNLNCKWCHNPEAKAYGRSLMFYSSYCKLCGGCTESCPKKAITITDGKKHIDRGVCDICGECETVCPEGAIKTVGRYVTIKELTDTIIQDKDYYVNSGGGVTFSGGEPMLQIGFCTELAKVCRKLGINVLIDTAANVPTEYFDLILPYADEYYVDLKLCSEEDYKKYTGGSLELTVSNITHLIERNCNVTVRIPIIPGVNDSPEHCRCLSGIIAGTGAKHVNLLPFHNLCKSKYAAMDTVFPCANTAPPSAEHMENIKKCFCDDLKVTIQW